ncbi:hypothetical protein J4214_04570 [Candidatus Woesearchaeota archaeon]|nr:hypothetical protein [Candidatus Woesearchaeota archaeon]
MNKMEKKKIWIGIFLSFILISGTLGLFYENSSDTNTSNNEIIINGIKIQKIQDNVFAVDNNGIRVIFNYLPEDLQNITLPEFSLLSDKIYIIFEPEQQIRAVTACSREESCDIDIPVKKCDNDAVYISRKNISRTYLMEKCLVLEGSDIDLNMYVDSLNYRISGVK